jgi:restriction endonuclease S subunit
MIDFVPLDKLLSRVVDNRGKTCPTAESGLPLIATNCVKNGRLFPILEKVRYVSDDTYRQWFRGHPEPDDLIFVTKGAPGQLCLAPDPINFCIAQDMVAMRANSAAVYPPYLFAALRSRQVQAAIVNMHVGTMIPHFKKGDFDKLLIPRPHRRMQQFIGDTYLLLSRKIELNRRMNETLEAMARAIFIDKEESLEWPELRLGDVCEIFDGPHATPKLTEDGPIFLGISNLSNGRLDLKTTNHVSHEDFVKWTRRVAPTAGDVVFSYETRLGQAGLIPQSLDCCLGRRMGLLRLRNDEISPTLLLRAYMERSFQETIRQRTIHGSTVDRIPLIELGGFPIRLPVGTDAAMLSRILEPFDAKIDANDRENKTLSVLRDLLLQKLMLGEVRFKDIESIAETAL